MHSKISMAHGREGPAACWANLMGGDFCITIHAVDNPDQSTLCPGPRDAGPGQLFTQLDNHAVGYYVRTIGLPRTLYTGSPQVLRTPLLLVATAFIGASQELTP